MIVASATTSVQPTDRWRGGIESMHTGVGPSGAGRSIFLSLANKSPNIELKAICDPSLGHLPPNFVTADSQ